MCKVVKAHYKSIQTDCYGSVLDSAWLYNVLDRILHISCGEMQRQVNDAADPNITCMEHLVHLHVNLDLDVIANVQIRIVRTLL